MADNPYATATPASAPAAAPAAPALGYGQRGEVAIDSVNQWMRGQPWYQALIRSFGQDPSNVHLNDSQKQQVIKAAQANGVVVDEGHNGQEVDDSGNFQAKSHTLRNTLIVAGIAAAALATAGAAGVFSGAAAGGAEAAGGGTLASTALSATGALATGATASGAVPAALAAGGAASGGALLPAVAGAAGTAAASKGISSWLAPVLQGVVPTVGGIVGATIAANANKEGSADQAKALADALDFEKQQYSDLTGRLAPYISAGTASSDRMSQLLGLPARTGTTATAPPARGPSVNPYAGPTPAAPPVVAPPASGQMVTLQAPDGTTKQVPAEQAAHYQSLGAKIVQAAA